MVVTALFPPNEILALLAPNIPVAAGAAAAMAAPKAAAPAAGAAEG
jgi:hypothetical protein